MLTSLRRSVRLGERRPPDLFDVFDDEHAVGTAALDLVEFLDVLHSLLELAA